MVHQSFRFSILIVALAGAFANAASSSSSRSSSSSSSSRSSSSSSSTRSSSGSSYSTGGSARGTFGGGGGYGSGFGGGGYSQRYESKPATPSPRPSPTPSPSPAPSKPWSKPVVEPSRPTPTPSPAPAPRDPPKSTWGRPSVEEQTPAPKPKQDNWSYGGKANGSMGSSTTVTTPEPTPRPSIKDAPWAKRASDVPPRTTNSNPYNGRTETKTNKDGSTSTRYYDENGKLRETERARNGRTLQNFKRDEDGNEVHTYGNSSVRITKSGNITTKEFSDGRKVILNKTTSRRTGNTIYYRNGSSQPEEYRNVQIRNQPTEVYVTRSSSFLDEPWFWLYMMERNNHQNHSGSNSGGGNYGGSNYGGGGSGYGGGGSTPTQTAPSVPQIKQDWSDLYEKLPAKYQGDKVYTSGDEYITDYVTFGLINDNRPTRGWFETHFCWIHSCADETKDYDIALQTRTALRNQVVQTLVDLKEKKEISLYKLLGENGLDPAAKDYLVIANESADAKLTADQSRCSIESGAILSLVDYSNDSGNVTATVLEQGGEPGDDAGEEECAIGKQVTFDATLAQKYQNEFLRLLDDAVTKASSKFSRAK